jgi:hypothetical protein
MLNERAREKVVAAQLCLYGGGRERRRTNGAEERDGAIVAAELDDNDAGNIKAVMTYHDLHH